MPVSLIRNEFTDAPAIAPALDGLPALPATNADHCSAALSRISVVDSYCSAAAHWPEPDDADWLATPFQTFHFLRTWQDNLGRRAGETPLLIICYDDRSQPVALLPLTQQRRAGLTVAAFAGGKHPTFNMALWRRDFAANVTSATLATLLNLIRKARPDIDLLTLERQPHHWGRHFNPLRLLAGQASINDCPILRLEGGAANTVSKSVRKRLRSKERKLEALPGYRHTIAASKADVERLLDSFFRIKPERMKLQKLPSVFSAPGVETFIRNIFARHRVDGREQYVIHALECDDEVLAIFAGVADGVHVSMMYNTYTLSDHARLSPGLVLIRKVFEHYAQQNYQFIDLGISSAEYKSFFCKDNADISDSFVPLTGRGRIAAPILAAGNRLKRRIKQNPRALDTLRTIERVLCFSCGKKV